MSKLSLVDFKNVFKYYKGQEHQIKAVEELFEHLPEEALSVYADWIRTYRKQTDDVKQRWPITKRDLATIMKRDVTSLSDELMDDYAACCRKYKLDLVNQAYFLGQVGHESGGLRYKIEWHDGSDYEYRHDLGNVSPGDGVKYAGTGFIQVTGRYWHTEFSRDIKDPKVIYEGKQYTADKYPWSISGFWWKRNSMISFCKTRPPVDAVGATVNGRYLPNGYIDRRAYSKRAFSVLGLPYPGDTEAS